MIRGRGGIQAAVAFALLAAAGSARAAARELSSEEGLPDGAPRVALLSSIADDSLAGRIDAELRAVGVAVSRALLSPATGIEDQVRGALGAGARAVVVAEGHRTDVWIAQAGSDRIGLRQQLEVEETSALQGVLALRTVEFLRISLGLVSEPKVAPLAAAEPEVATATAVPPAPAPRRWMTVDASSGMLASGGGGGAIAIAGIGLRGQLFGMLGGELCFYAPLSEKPLTNSDGTARTSAWMAGGGLLLAPRRDGRLSIEVALGAMAALIRSSGTPSPGAAADGYIERALRTVIYGRSAARLRVARRVSLRLDLLGGTVINPPAVTFSVYQGTQLVSSQVATWGGVFVAGLGGAELRF